MGVLSLDDKFFVCAGQHKQAFSATLTFLMTFNVPGLEEVVFIVLVVPLSSVS